ncbi:MAG: DUF2513 domain-containing protein [Thermoanaerobaculaceae bacterium]|nr:DUF2513 domain-containing protein [Thermoanaerobaculaceae bacterium]MDI9621429.1 DUF2513 domain-containing protein [Acidobacteriota bacterium]NLH12328.1 DUF2513 domain-containing protein [Holophagae bacterium]HPW55478.1 DUF2513 domain-containing protein [Thermoanaerobaculaceae bacterium]
MRRDLELLRTIMLRTEAVSPGTNLLELGLEETDFAALSHHVELLVEAGLLKAQISYMERSPVPVYVVVERLTWEGHEFLDLARDDRRWRSVLSRVTTGTGGTSFEIVRDLLREAHVAALTRH